MNRLQELFNVNYFIVSQTNPHAIPFVQRAQRQAVRRQVRRASHIIIIIIIIIVNSYSCVLYETPRHPLRSARPAPGRTGG